MLASIVKHRCSILHCTNYIVEEISQSYKYSLTNVGFSSGQEIPFTNLENDFLSNLLFRLEKKDGNNLSKKLLDRLNLFLLDSGSSSGIEIQVSPAGSSSDRKILSESESYTENCSERTLLSKEDTDWLCWRGSAVSEHCGFTWLGV